MSVSKFKNQASFRNHGIFGLLFVVILVIVSLSLVTVVYQWEWRHGDLATWSKRLTSVTSVKEVVLLASSPVAGIGDEKCHFYNCFNVYRCGRRVPYKLTVYVYPWTSYVDGRGEPALNPISKEYRDIVSAIKESQYYTPDPESACILVPTIDTLNQNRLNPNAIGQALQSLAQ